MMNIVDISKRKKQQTIIIVNAGCFLETQNIYICVEDTNFKWVLRLRTHLGITSTYRAFVLLQYETGKRWKLELEQNIFVYDWLSRLTMRMLTCLAWWERTLVAVSPTACLESGANVRPWESRIWRASAVASNKLCYSLSLWHLYRSFIPHTGPGWRRRWGHCSNGHLFWIICNLTVLLSYNAANNIIYLLSNPCYKY